MLRKCVCAIVFSGACVCACAQDGWASRDYEFASRMQSDFISRFERDLVSPVQRGVRAGKAAAPAQGASAAGAAVVARGATTVVPARSPRVPQQMARAYPDDQQAMVQRTFEELLSGYRRIEQQFGIEPYDVASGLAAFLAGSYMGFHHTGFPDQQFKPLVMQMRAILAAEPGWARISVADKQDMYEQLAIIGMLMARTQMALARQPDAQAQAAMQGAARAYLEQLLKVDAAKVQLTAQGLGVR